MRGHMGSHFEDCAHNVGESPVHDAGRWQEPGRAYFCQRFRGLPGMGGPLRVTWPLNEDEHALMEARRNLEQVGQILRRLELDRTEIAELREETRTILARLAA